MPVAMHAMPNTLIRALTGLRRDPVPEGEDESRYVSEERESE